MSALLGERDRLIMNTVPRYSTPLDRALMLTASATMFEVSLAGVPTPASITFSALMLGAVGAITFSSEPAVPLTVANGNAVLSYADMGASIVTVTAATVIEGVTYRARQTVAKQQALDLTPPPAPTGLVVTGHSATITLVWDAVPANYGNLSHTEVWRAPVNNFARAALAGRADGREYTDPVGPGAARYYWIRYVSRAAIPGPYNAASGTVGASDVEVEHLLQVLTGEITESQLYADLGAKIDLIEPMHDAVADLEVVYGDTVSAAASAAQAAQAAADALLDAAKADTAAGGASQYASQANQSATNASAAAGAAMTSAGQSSQAASAASTSAGQSSQAASAAGGSAAAAAISASTAANAAGDAGASASAASTSKEAAAGSVTAAGVQAAASSQSAIEAKAAREAAGNSASSALQSAGTASASSTAAGNAASQAATSAELAVGAKNTATGAAASASQSAGAAGTAETNAAGSASQAATSAQLAAESRNAAGGSAAAAAGSASTAATKSTEAGQSATAANSARIAAEAASGQATGAAAAASGSASTADARATAAGQSATAANTSATTASTAAGQAGVFATQAATSKTAADGSAAAAASSLQQVQAIYRADLTNLCQDPTFAKGAANWNQVGMIPQEDGGSGGWPFATCALVTGANSTQIAPQVLVSPGDTHYFSAWVSNQSGPGAPTFSIGAYFTGVGYQSVVAAATCTASQSTYNWVRISGSLTVPAGARTANLWLGIAGDVGVFWAVTGIEWRPSQVVQALSAIVNTEIQTRADQYLATSNRIDTVQASITGPDGLAGKYAAVKVTAEATASALGQVQAKYGVQLDADGVAGGLELLAGGGRLDFGVRASMFFIAAPAGSGIASSVPFIVRTTETVIGGVTIPIGMYVADAFIQNASITNAKIGGDIWSSNFVAGQSGWRLYRSGDMEINNLHARGTVTGGGFTNVYDWPTNGQGGFHLSASGLLLGNARTGGYFQVEPNGDFYTPGLSVVNRVAIFSGTVSGLIGTFQLVRSPGRSGPAGNAGSGAGYDQTGTGLYFYDGVHALPTIELGGYL